MRNLFDQIRQVIEDQTNTTPARVKNLHGTVEETVRVQSEASSHAWYGLTVETNTLLTLRQFADLYSLQRNPVQEVTGRAGVSSFPASGTFPTTLSSALFGAVNVGAPTDLPLTIKSPGNEIALYVEDRLVQRANGTIKTTVKLPAGTTHVAIIAYGSGRPISVVAPEDVGIMKVEPQPPAPVLAALPEVGYLKADNGSYVVTLSWLNDAYASAWQVYRSATVPVGVIQSFSVAEDNTATIRVTGALTETTPKGTLFLTKLGNIGAVEQGTDTTDVSGEPVTDFLVALTPQASRTEADYIGAQFFRSTESYKSLTRVSYSGDAVVTYSDGAVSAQQIYVYRISAYGFITGVAESDLSDPVAVWVQDRVPPGNIIFTVPDDLQIVNGEVYVSYVAPADGDYRGVRVYLEDSNDATAQTPLITETGYAGSPDALSFRPPRAGRYWFRSFDWAGNEQPVGQGVPFDWDGNGGYLNALASLLTATTAETDEVTSLSLRLTGPESLFPVQVRIFRDQLISPMVLDDSQTTTAIVQTAGTIGPADYSGLGAIALPLNGAVQFYAEITDASGNVTFAYSTADRGSLPGGSVVVEDYLSFPVLTCLFDEDTEQIKITVPDDLGAVLGTVTYTRQGGGLPDSGGGEVIYTVGNVSVLKADNTTVGEANIPVDGRRGTYTVEYISGGTVARVWQGALHGAPSNPPTLDPEVILDATQRNAVDVYVTLSSYHGERVTLSMKDEDDPALPVWLLVVDEDATTLRYVDSGTQVGPESWFKRADSSVWAQKLNAIALRDGQNKRISLLATGEDSQVSSAWQMVALPLKEIPVIQAVDLVWDETSDTLYLSATGGNFCQSARFEISDDPTFTAVIEVQEYDLDTDSRVTHPLTLLEADRGKRWYGRVTPFNGPLVSSAVTGLGGLASSDTEFVPSLTGPTPKGVMVLQVDSDGVVTLLVNKGDNSLSFGYTTSTSGYDFTGTQTYTDFGVNTVLTIPLGTLTSGDTLYVAGWFYSGAGGTGDVSDVQVDSTSFNAALAPRFEYVIQLRDPGAADQPRVDFRIGLADPSNLGGTLFAWVNKDGQTSANPLGTADTQVAIGSTPFEANFTNFPTGANNIKGSGAEDKLIYYEFVNSAGQSTGKKEVRVTSLLIDIGPDGTLNDGVIDLTKLVPGLTAVQIVSGLPASAPDGTVVFLTVDGKIYRRTAGVWTAQVPTVDLTGQITTTQITDSAISTQKLAALSITAGKIATNAITAGKIAANAVTAGTIAAGAVTADAIQAGAVTAGKISVSSLSSITTNAGIIVQGKLQSADGQRFLDLNAAGATSFMHHPRFDLLADGNAIFQGTIQLRSPDGGSYVSFSDDFGSEFATIKAVNASDIGWTNSMRFTVRGQTLFEAGFLNHRAGTTLIFEPLFLVRAVEHISFLTDSFIAGVGGNTLVTEGVVLWDFTNYKGEHGRWTWGMMHGTETAGATTIPFGLKLMWNETNLRFVFGTDGTARADVAWSTFSPKPPKDFAQMTAGEWINWGSEDAKKPVKPYEGIPSRDHPEIKRLAKERQQHPDMVAANELLRYEKDVAKIAIGTANWGALVWDSLQKAKDFDEFKRLLGL